MARYTGPLCKLCRREMTPLMLKGQRCFTDKCAVKKRKYPPGPPRKRRGKLSEFGVQLREKQKIRRTYGLLEKQFQRTFEEANRMKGVTGDNMLSLLERRLDNVVHRMGFASSRIQARQFVQHGHVLVDGRMVDISSFRVKVGTVIEVKENYKANVMLEDSIKLAKALGSVPEWIEVDFENKKAKILRLPTRQDITFPFSEQLVVEFYSK